MPGRRHLRWLDVHELAEEVGTTPRSLFRHQHRFETRRTPVVWKTEFLWPESRGVWQDIERTRWMWRWRAAGNREISDAELWIWRDRSPKRLADELGLSQSSLWNHARRRGWRWARVPGGTRKNPKIILVEAPCRGCRSVYNVEPEDSDRLCAECLMLTGLERQA